MAEKFEGQGPTPSVHFREEFVLQSCPLREIWLLLHVLYMCHLTRSKPISRGWAAKPVNHNSQLASNKCSWLAHCSKSKFYASVEFHEIVSAQINMSHYNWGLLQSKTLQWIICDDLNVNKVFFFCLSKLHFLFWIKQHGGGSHSGNI